MTTVARLKTVVVPVCTSCTRTWLSPAHVATMLSPATEQSITLLLKQVVVNVSGYRSRRLH